MSRQRRSTVGLLAVSILLALALAGCAQEPTDTGSPADTTEQATPSAPAGKDVKTIYVAGGCFWGLEKYIGLVNGVVDAEVGYANGANASATYGDGSGYAEAVKVVYDPTVAPLPFLLDLFYDAIDPTSVNRQGNDLGTEYRTGIYYTDPTDEAVIERSLARLQTRVHGAHRGREWSAHHLHPRRGLPPGLPAEEPRRLLPHPGEALRRGFSRAAGVGRHPAQIPACRVPAGQPPGALPSPRPQSRLGSNRREAVSHLSTETRELRPAPVPDRAPCTIAAAEDGRPRRREERHALRPSSDGPSNPGGTRETSHLAAARPGAGGAAARPSRRLGPDLRPGRRPAPHRGLPADHRDLADQPGHLAHRHGLRRFDPPTTLAPSTWPPSSRSSASGSASSGYRSTRWSSRAPA